MGTHSHKLAHVLFCTLLSRGCGRLGLAGRRSRRCLRTRVVNRLVPTAHRPLPVARASKRAERRNERWLPLATIWEGQRRPSALRWRTCARRESRRQRARLELRPADTYEALCDSLIQLDEAVEEIFGRVERRVAEEQRTLKGLEERIERAGVLARRVAGSNAATCVLSAARYPAPDKLPDYRRLFYDDELFAANARKVRRLEKLDAVRVPIPHLVSFSLALALT